MVNNKVLLYDLTARQIYIEIIKRFPKMECNEENALGDIFGEEWDFLNKNMRKAAAIWFRAGIEMKEIKGIIYDKLEDGSLLYKRIPNDKYRRG